MLQRQIADRVIVEPLRLRVDPIRDHAITLTRYVELGTVGEVTTLVEVQAHQRVSRFHQRPVHTQVSRGAGKRLDVHVDVLWAYRAVREDLGASPLSQRLHQVHVVLALVKPTVGVASVEGELPWHVTEPLFRVQRHPRWRITLGVDVLEARAQSLPNGLWCIGLRWDEDQLSSLPLILPADEIGDEGCGVFEVISKQEIR